MISFSERAAVNLVSLCQCVGLAFCIRARIFRLVGIGSKLFFFKLSMFQFMLNTILGNEM
jgi:hypothetical protein